MLVEQDETIIIAIIGNSLNSLNKFVWIIYCQCGNVIDILTVLLSCSLFYCY